MSSSHTPEDQQDLSAQIVRLEERLAFQQRCYEELNSVVLEQQAEQERLRKELQALRQLLQGVIDRGLGEDLPHEKPPHY